MRRFTVSLLVLGLLTGCTGKTKVPLITSLYILQLTPSALLQISPGGEVQRGLPLGIPSGCAVKGVNAPPVGNTLAIEYGCEFGPAVVFLDTETGRAWQPVTDSDSHFLAWAPDGSAAYLKVDSINRPRIVRAPLNGKVRSVPITELTYDLSPKPGTEADFLFSFSRGMSTGSEMWYAQDGGRVVQQVAADTRSYLSFARWSPDGSKIAFIKIPDSATPFTVGELWVMDADGSHARKLADADAGHGYAAAWSPDSKRIAFVVRDNPYDTQADQYADVLKSGLSIVDVDSGQQTRMTHFPDARVEAPAWSPDGNRVAFTIVLDDKMNVYSVNMNSGAAQSVLAVSACCPVWMQR